MTFIMEQLPNSSQVNWKMSILEINGLRWGKMTTETLKKLKSLVKDIAETNPYDYRNRCNYCLEYEKNGHKDTCSHATAISLHYSDVLDTIETEYDGETPEGQCLD